MHWRRKRQPTPVFFFFIFQSSILAWRIPWTRGLVGPGLISFRMDWLDLLAVQGTLKSLLQQHSSEASILWHLGFFIVIFPGGSDGKASVYNAYHVGDPASSPDSPHWTCASYLHCTASRLGTQSRICYDQLCSERLNLNIRRKMLVLVGGT